MKLNKNVIIIIFSICVIISCLSGCIENDTQGEDDSNDEYDFNNDQGQDNDKNNDNPLEEEDTDSFIGTWTGNLVLESEKGDTIITEFKFEKNTVDVTMRYEFEQEDDEDKSDDKWWNWRDEGEKNEEEKSDSYILTYNYEVQGDELVLESPSEKDGKTSTTVYSYSFNDGYDVLYIEGAAFTKN